MVQKKYIRLCWSIKGLIRHKVYRLLRNLTLVAKLYIDRTSYLAANLDWPLYQLDVKNVFLNGNLEDVHMDGPPGFKGKLGKNAQIERKKKDIMC